MEIIPSADLPILTMTFECGASCFEIITGNDFIWSRGYYKILLDISVGKLAGQKASTGSKSAEQKINLGIIIFASFRA